MSSRLWNEIGLRLNPCSATDKLFDPVQLTQPL